MEDDPVVPSFREWPSYKPVGGWEQRYKLHAYTTCPHVGKQSSAMLGLISWKPWASDSDRALVHHGCSVISLSLPLISFLSHGSVGWGGAQTESNCPSCVRKSQLVFKFSFIVPMFVSSKICLWFLWFSQLLYGFLAHPLYSFETVWPSVKHPSSVCPVFSEICASDFLWCF